MASSVIGILSTLGLSTDSTLEEILTKLVDYNLVTTDELHNIQNISVKPLPNIVRNQADILKQRMYGIATDEDYGLPIVINRRMVLIRYILDKLNIKLDNSIIDIRGIIDKLEIDLTDGTIIVKKAYNDSDGNNIAQTYETKSDATTKNTTITQNVETLKTNLGNGAFIVKKAETDGANNVIHTTYETKVDANTKLSSAKIYTDTKLDELKRTLLGDNYDELYDTFKEISDYISSDKTFAQDILTKIEKNQRDISTNTSNIETQNIRLNNLDSTVSLKANSSEVYKKTETYSQQEIDKLFEDNNNIQFVADDSATIHESITPLDNSTLIGNWIFINEDFVEREMYSSNVNIAFKDSLGNEYKRIYFEPHSLKTENDKEYCKISVKGALEDDTYILIFNPVSKTGLAYNEQGILKNSYRLIFEKSGVTSSSVLQELILIANKVKFSTNVISDEFKYNNENIATIKDLDKKADISYVDEKVSNLVNSAPETLDTLGELAQALEENDSVVETLNSAITNKAEKTELFSRNYEDLTNKPLIPTKTSELTNDSNFLTQHQDISGKANKTYVDEELSKKVDKVEGKGLSTNDYTNEEKTKLSNLENYDDTELREEIDTKIGDINSILDTLNGEVV